MNMTISSSHIQQTVKPTSATSQRSLPGSLFFEVESSELDASRTIGVLASDDTEHDNSTKISERTPGATRSFPTFMLLVAWDRTAAKISSEIFQLWPLPYFRIGMRTIESCTSNMCISTLGPYKPDMVVFSMVAFREPLEV